MGLGNLGDSLSNLDLGQLPAVHAELGLPDQQGRGHIGAPEQ